MLQLSLVRNYLEGSTDVLANSSNLQTLMLASNYFSQDVVELDDAENLGIGVYQAVSRLRLKSVGESIKKEAVNARHPCLLCCFDFTYAQKRTLDDSGINGPAAVILKLRLQYYGLMYWSNSGRSVLSLFSLPSSDPFSW